jgi:septation ring formation regulator EzrA
VQITAPILSLYENQFTQINKNIDEFIRLYYEKTELIGHPNSLRNNLQKSISAKNFHTFWNYWNPSLAII